jgi:hypothetical protein
VKRFIIEGRREWYIWWKSHGMGLSRWIRR